MCSSLTWLQLLPLFPLDPAVLVLDPRLRQDHPRELGPRPHVEVRQLDLRSHCESNQTGDGTDSVPVVKIWMRPDVSTAGARVNEGEFSDSDSSN